jgi:hypothetical protein
MPAASVASVESSPGLARLRDYPGLHGARRFQPGRVVSLARCPFPEPLFLP